jgi:hypothetical protein
MFVVLFKCQKNTVCCPLVLTPWSEFVLTLVSVRLDMFASDTLLLSTTTDGTWASYKSIHRKQFDRARGPACRDVARNIRVIDASRRGAEGHSSRNTCFRSERVRGRLLRALTGKGPQTPRKASTVPHPSITPHLYSPFMERSLGLQSSAPC